MMLPQPNCSKRNCKWFVGLKSQEEPVFTCIAFPDGIPEAIAYGANKHARPLEEQDNDLIYEPENE